jgi:hypothetical protein
MHNDRKAHPHDILAASRSNICIIMKVIFTPATAKGYSKTTPFLPCFIKRFWKEVCNTNRNFRINENKLLAE